MLSAQASAAFSRLGLDTASPIPGVYNGTWRATGPVTTSLNPATGAPLAQVVQASPTDVEATLVAAREAYAVWRSVSAPKRGEVLRQMREAVAKHKDDLGLVVSLESSKILSEGRGEVQEVIDMFDLAVGQSRQVGGAVFPSEREKHTIIEVANPLGVVAVVSGPPIITASRNIAQALYFRALDKCI